MEFKLYTSTHVVVSDGRVVTVEPVVVLLILQWFRLPLFVIKHPAATVTGINPIKLMLRVISLSANELIDRGETIDELRRDVRTLRKQHE